MKKSFGHSIHHKGDDQKIGQSNFQHTLVDVHMYVWEKNESKKIIPSVLKQFAVIFVEKKAKTFLSKTLFEFNVCSFLIVEFLIWLKVIFFFFFCVCVELNLWNTWWPFTPFFIIFFLFLPRDPS